MSHLTAIRYLLLKEMIRKLLESLINQAKQKFDNLKDLSDTDERGDDGEGQAAEQTPHSSRSGDFEQPSTNLSEWVLESVPTATTDQQVLATHTAEDILRSENPLSLEVPPPGSNDLPGGSFPQSEEERVCSPSPSLSDRSNDSALNSILRPTSDAPAGLGLGPDSLGIPDIPPLSSFHNIATQSAQSATGNFDPAQERDSIGSPKPGGRSNFHESENVQVHGGNFVAASTTVVNNNYYVTHFHGTPSPPPRSSNRGNTRAYSIHI
ncbi:hypothetical protein BKA70DRAFT_1440851 [Coprinopsis sp. MPI-PUGE-AT-0042]|nr:hypothetical protein BKA70DRAFT_1440851 [Coprinopsis sp. MPI-PUGE-AT-0042]